jgi:hypothetical protein
VRLIARALLAAALIGGYQGAPVVAQQARLSITVAALLSVEPAAEAAFPIQVTPRDTVPPGCFIRLRGLPTTAALSEGHSIAPGAWAVPVGALPRLKVLLPRDAAGRSAVSITLVSADGSVLAEAKSTLVVAAAAPKAATVLRAAPPPQPPTRDTPPAPPAPAVGPRLSPEARERALRLVKKGDEQLAEGGIAQARLLYERAAEAGLALGAMALAATYDPVELQHLGALGLKPDHDAARKWYERARQLGAPEAEARLRRLGAN